MLFVLFVCLFFGTFGVLHICPTAVAFNGVCVYIYIYMIFDRIVPENRALCTITFAYDMLCFCSICCQTSNWKD